MNWSIRLQQTIACVIERVCVSAVSMHKNERVHIHADENVNLNVNDGAHVHEDTEHKVCGTRMTEVEAEMAAKMKNPWRTHLQKQPCANDAAASVARTVRKSADLCDSTSESEWAMMIWRVLVRARDTQTLHQ